MLAITPALARAFLLPLVSIAANPTPAVSLNPISAESPATDDERPPVATLAAVGDIRLDGPVGEIIRAKGPQAPTSGVSQLLKSDILFGNLECPVTQRGQKFSKKWNFRAPPANLKALKAAGFSLVNLANNHVMDYGPDGLVDTVKSLDKIGLPHIGAGRNLDEALRPVFLSANGIRVGFLGFTSTFPEEAWAHHAKPGVAFANFSILPEVIRDAKRRCDVLIVSFHGGTELAEDPNETQQSFARAAIDAGADLFLGHHPHVIQPVEIYRGRIIVYSIGNFMFVSPTPTTKFSVIARANLSKKGVEGIEFIPIDTNYGLLKPAPAEGVAWVRAALNRRGALDQSSLLRVRP